MQKLKTKWRVFLRAFFGKEVFPWLICLSLLVGIPGDVSLGNLYLAKWGVFVFWVFFLIRAMQSEVNFPKSIISIFLLCQFLFSVFFPWRSGVETLEVSVSLKRGALEGAIALFASSFWARTLQEAYFPGKLGLKYFLGTQLVKALRALALGCSLIAPFLHLDPTRVPFFGASGLFLIFVWSMVPLWGRRPWLHTAASLSALYCSYALHSRVGLLLGALLAIFYTLYAIQNFSEGFCEEVFTVFRGSVPKNRGPWRLVFLTCLFLFLLSRNLPEVFLSPDRISLWQAYLQAWWSGHPDAFPMNAWLGGWGSRLFGWGQGSSTTMLPIVQALSGLPHAKSGWFLWAHNDWLQGLVEWGILGFGLFLGMYLKLLRQMAKNSFLLASFLAYSAGAFFWMPSHFAFSWFCLLSVTALSFQKEEEWVKCGLK